MRALGCAALAALTLAGGGCTKVRACRAGTVLVSVDGRAVGASDVRLTLTLDGVVKGTSPSYALPSSGAGTLEIDLRGDYATGRHVVVDAEALAGDLIVGQGQVDTTLAATCTALALPLAASSGDDLGGGGGDGGGDDLSLASPDLLPGPIVPSHTTATFGAGAADLPTNITIIDTDALSYVAGGNSVTPGPTILFADSNNRAVLRVGAWTAQSPVRVNGARALIVLANGAVDLQAAIDASATNLWSNNSTTPVPGPGGFGSAAGIGAGLPGVSGGRRGGGGGSFGTVGSNGAGFSGTTGGAPGPVFGGMLTDLYGGAGGGSGFTFQSTCNGGTGLVPGGAGGGVVQITSATSIIVRAGAGVNVGGSGGNPGCDANNGDGGGGGGAGGEVFLEAPTITVNGTLAANGGGGGSGPSDTGTEVAGATGTLGTTPAAGGNNGKGGNGGNGAAGSTAATAGAAVGGDGCGGGGGGQGRIWLRTRGVAADTTGATLSPAAMIDQTL